MCSDHLVWFAFHLHFSSALQPVGPAVYTHASVSLCSCQRGQTLYGRRLAYEPPLHRPPRCKHRAISTYCYLQAAPAIQPGCEAVVLVVRQRRGDGRGYTAARTERATLLQLHELKPFGVLKVCSCGAGVCVIGLHGHGMISVAADS